MDLNLNKQTNMQQQQFQRAGKQPVSDDIQKMKNKLDNL